MTPIDCLLFVLGNIDVIKLKFRIEAIGIVMRLANTLDSKLTCGQHVAEYCEILIFSFEHCAI